MRKTRLKFRIPLAASLLTISVMLGVGVGLAQSDQHHAKHPHGGASDIADVADQAVGIVPPGEESHAVDYNKPPLAIDLSLFIYSLLLFGGFVLVMKSVAWEPLIAGLNAREAR